MADEAVLADTLGAYEDRYSAIRIQWWTRLGNVIYDFVPELDACITEELRVQEEYWDFVKYLDQEYGSEGLFDWCPSRLRWDIQGLVWNAYHMDSTFGCPDSSRYWEIRDKREDRFGGYIPADCQGNLDILAGCEWDLEQLYAGFIQEVREFQKEEEEWGGNASEEDFSDLEGQNCVTPVHSTLVSGNSFLTSAPVVAPASGSGEIVLPDTPFSLDCLLPELRGGNSFPLSEEDASASGDGTDISPERPVAPFPVFPAAVDETQVPTSSNCVPQLMGGSEPISPLQPPAVVGVREPSSSPKMLPLVGVEDALGAELCVLPRIMSDAAWRDGTAVSLQGEERPVCDGLQEEDPSGLERSSAAGPPEDVLCERRGGSQPISLPENPAVMSMREPSSSPKMLPLVRVEDALGAEPCGLPRITNNAALRDGTAVSLKEKERPGCDGLPEEDPSGLEESRAAGTPLDILYDLMGREECPISPPVDPGLVSRSELTRAQDTPAVVKETQVPTSSPNLSSVVGALEKGKMVFSRCLSKIAGRFGSASLLKKRSGPEEEALHAKEISRLPLCSTDSLDTPLSVNPDLVHGSKRTRSCEALAGMSGTAVLIPSPTPVLPFPETPGLVNGGPVMLKEPVFTPTLEIPTLVSGTAILTKDNCVAMSPVDPSLVGGNVLPIRPIPDLTQERGNCIRSCPSGALAQLKGGDVPLSPNSAAQKPASSLPQGDPPYRLALDPEPLAPDPEGFDCSTAWRRAQERPPNLLLVRATQYQFPWPRTKDK